MECGGVFGPRRGGCEEASLSVAGRPQPADRVALIDLAYSVIIRNEHGKCRLVGLCGRCGCEFGGVTVGLDVETVRNRVSVAYTERAADGGQARHDALGR